MDEKFVLTLIDKFTAANVGELEFSDGGAKLLLRKNAPGGPAPAGNAAPHDQVHLGLHGAAKTVESAGGELITSHIVGTFYPSPSPDAPPFVRAGSQVKAGDTLCILEAMKMMNHLEAEFDCEILSVKAAGGDLVEFGQGLFEVRRRA